MLVALAFVAGPVLAADADDVWDRVDHHYASNGDVKIHYATLGQGKPIVFVHGFPDIWYSWRHQMNALSATYRTAAIDGRGYNQSDKPKGIDNYKMPHLVADIAAVIADMGEEKVTLVGHDWGGAIAWRFAMVHSDKVERLVILNLTHPKGYAAVVANPTPEQDANVQYARRFASSEPDGSAMPDRFGAMADGMGPVVGAHYKEAFGRSYFDGMLNYYRANYNDVADGAWNDAPNLPMSVLQFHGLQDSAVDKDGLKGTWDWIDNDYTLVTVPSAGHFVQWEAPEMVSETMRAWLGARD